MSIRRNCFLLLSLLATPLLVLSQVTTAAGDAVYRSEIKSVACYNANKEGSFPLITLGSNEQIELTFDDLSGQSHEYYYTLQHCEADWSPSNLSPAEYLQGFNEDRILDYTYSSGTLQKYVHYDIKLPNQNIIPKQSGNYLLKVYENGNQQQLVLTRRVYVVSSKASVVADVQPSSNIGLRATNQKINFQVDYGSLQVQNPYSDIKVLLLQNNRPETAIMNTRPYLVRGTQLVYNDISTNDVPGGNEFRLIDLRTLKLNSERVFKIYKDTANTIILLNDFPRDQPNYLFQYDDNGNFFIRNQDGSNAAIDADYAHVYFTLAANKTEQEGSAYIVGWFNNYQLTNASKLSFDAGRKRFYTDLYLKQGIYDYQYVWVDKATGKPDYTLLEGSHFETENDYQLLVYYHPAGSRYDELVGYRLLNTAKR